MSTSTTISNFSSGHPVEIEYTGTFTAVEVMKFVSRKLNPVMPLNDSQEVNNFLQIWGSVALAFFGEERKFGDWKTTEWKAFKSCAADPRTNEIGFGVVLTEELALNHSIQGSPDITIFRRFDASSKQIEKGDWRYLCDWIREEGIPPVGMEVISNLCSQLEQYELKKYQKALLETLPIGLLYLDAKRHERSAALLKELKKRTDHFRGKIKLFYIQDGYSSYCDLLWVAQQL